MPASPDPVPQRVGNAVVAAISGLVAWWVSQWVHGHIAASREVVSMAVVGLGWRPCWPDLPGLLAVGAVAVAWFRALRRPASAGSIQARLFRFAALAVGLCALRFASLLPAAMAMVPLASLAWTPHASWALALAGWLWLGLPEGWRPGASREERQAGWRVPAALFVCSALLFGAWTLYYCQVTMVHGDEGQYLRVTQSLLHDPGAGSVQLPLEQHLHGLARPPYLPEPDHGTLPGPHGQFSVRALPHQVARAVPAATGHRDMAPKTSRSIHLRAGLGSGHTALLRSGSPWRPTIQLVVEFPDSLETGSYDMV